MDFGRYQGYQETRSTMISCFNIMALWYHIWCHIWYHGSGPWYHGIMISYMISSMISYHVWCWCLMSCMIHKVWCWYFSDNISYMISYIVYVCDVTRRGGQPKLASAAGSRQIKRAERVARAPRRCKAHHQFANCNPTFMLAQQRIKLQPLLANKLKFLWNSDDGLLCWLDVVVDSEDLMRQKPLIWPNSGQTHDGRSACMKELVCTCTLHQQEFWKGQSH